MILTFHEMELNRTFQWVTLFIFSVTHIVIKKGSFARFWVSSAVIGNYRSCNTWWHSTTRETASVVSSLVRCSEKPSNHLLAEVFRGFSAVRQMPGDLCTAPGSFHCHPYHLRPTWLTWHSGKGGLCPKTRTGAGSTATIV